MKNNLTYPKWARDNYHECDYTEHDKSVDFNWCVCGLEEEDDGIPDEPAYEKDDD